MREPLPQESFKCPTRTYPVLSKEDFERYVLSNIAKEIPADVKLRTCIIALRKGFINQDEYNTAVQNIRSSRR